MTKEEIQRYAVQVDNFYKGKGKVCLYATAGLKELKSKTPVLKLSEASVLCLYLFNQENNRSVKYYLDGGDEIYILRKTEMLMSRDIMQDGKEEMPVTDEPAYTVQIKRGKYRDMTPAEIINEKGIQALNEVVTELQQSISNPQNVRFRDINVRQYNACVQAFELVRNGQLKKVGSAKPYVIWKGLKTPNNKKVDQRGLTEVRTFSVSYTRGAEEPYEIKITNCMAPPVQGAQIGARISQATDEVSMAVRMNEKDWYCFWSELVNTKNAYSAYAAPSRIQYAEANAWRPDPVRKAGTYVPA